MSFSQSGRKSKKLQFFDKKDGRILTRRPILYEDEWLIALDKPAGVLSHPNPGGPSAACAFEGRYDPKERKFSTPEGPIWLIHRLDQDTSGVLLASKGEDVAVRLRQLFQEQNIRKTYLALVVGRPSPPSGIWRDHLEKRVAQGMVRSMVRPGLPPNAELKYTVDASYKEDFGQEFEIFPYFGRISLLEIILLTGRTHQIRVQAAQRRHPLAGDRIYGDFAFNRELRHRMGLRRLFLHAQKLELVHPLSGRLLKLEAPLPEDLRIPLGQIRGKRGIQKPKK